MVVKTLLENVLRVSAKFLGFDANGVGSDCIVRNPLPNRIRFGVALMLLGREWGATKDPRVASRPGALTPVERQASSGRKRPLA